VLIGFIHGICDCHFSSTLTNRMCVNFYIINYYASNFKYKYMFSQLLLLLLLLLLLFSLYESIALK